MPLPLEAVRPMNASSAVQSSQPKQAPLRMDLDQRTQPCPWCGQPISPQKFREIEARIRKEEQERLARAKEAMRKDFAGREAAIRKQAHEEAAQKVKALQEETERGHQEELKKLRTLLAKANDQALLKRQGEFNREREGWQKKVRELERKLSQRTAHEAGDGAEIDLYEALREAFPGDKISRVPKGEAGGDILHEILYKGGACGSILIDSKNRQSWQNVFVSKLRQDQVAAKTDHAILATVVFPAGKKELCIEDGVIVTSPGRVVHIVTLLRSAAVRMYLLGLSVKERTGKMSRLYKFITSDAYGHLIGEAGKLTGDILDVDVEEQREHQNTWKKRGSFATRLRNVLREIETEISAILEDPES